MFLENGLSFAGGTRDTLPSLARSSPLVSSAASRTTYAPARAGFGSHSDPYAVPRRRCPNFFTSCWKLTLSLICRVTSRSGSDTELEIEDFDIRHGVYYQATSAALVGKILSRLEIDFSRFVSGMLKNGERAVGCTFMNHCNT